MIKKRILVTGANGYIGTHVVAEILRRGHEAIACDLKFDNVPAAASRLEMNIFDPETDFPRKLENVDCVIHLAWRNGFQHNAMSHIEDLPLHTQFLRCLLDAGVGTVCVMGSMHEVGYWEGAICADTPTNPLSLYGIAKNSLRQIGQLMFQGTDAHFRWLRGYYIYGDDERNHSVLAKILQADRKGQDWFPFTSGKNLYDYLPVDELARQISEEGYLAIIHVVKGAFTSHEHYMVLADYQQVDGQGMFLVADPYELQSRYSSWDQLKKLDSEHQGLIYATKDILYRDCKAVILFEQDRRDFPLFSNCLKPESFPVPGM